MYSKETRAFEGYRGTWALRTLRQLGTQRKLRHSNNQGNWALGHLGTWAFLHSRAQALEGLYLPDLYIKDEVSSLDNHSDISEIKHLCLKSPQNKFFWYLNTKSVWNKFRNMSSIVSEDVDILTNIDPSFPTTQFSIPGFHHPFRLDINKRSGGLLV